MNGQMMLPEFDHEMANTRKTLERVDDGRFDWKPHEKSFSLKGLAGHIANIPPWVKVTLDTEELDVGQDFDQPTFESTADILAYFDGQVAEARAALEAASGEDLMAPWSMVMEGETIFSMPKAAVIRSFIFNHNVHHRGQLTVYLRLLDIPVPAVYGPSADEQE